MDKWLILGIVFYFMAASLHIFAKIIVYEGSWLNRIVMSITIYIL